MPPAVAIVLAGGASSRFGSDKLAAELDGRPLLHHTLSAVSQVAHVIVVVIAPGAAEPVVPDRLDLRVEFARDAGTHRGPLAGLAAGLSAPGTANADIALVVGGDMPWLEPAVLRLLAQRLAANPDAGVATLEADPMPSLPMAVRAATARPWVDGLLADDRRALRGLLDRLPGLVVPAMAWRALDPAANTLRDVDRPGDLA